MQNVSELGLSTLQAQLVGGGFSLAFAVFLGSAIFFFVSRMDIAPAYRSAVTISGVIVTIAGYHYFQIMRNFDKALVEGVLFNEAYRYVDWVVTVPLLLTELVLVLSISAARRRALLNKLVPYSFLMIVLGYPGEVSDVESTQYIFWALAMVFFVLILVTLFGELTKQIASENAAVQGTLKTLRTVLLVTWSFYPIAYLAPVLIPDAALGFVVVNFGYAVADITSKVGYGLLIHHVAKLKTENNIVSV